MLISFKVNEFQLLIYCCVKNDWQMSMNNGENSLLVPGMVMKTGGRELSCVPLL